MDQNIKLFEKMIVRRWSCRNVNASWMSQHKLRDKIRNKYIGKGLRVANPKEKMKENRLKWFGVCEDRELSNK